jgi:hypothetical protein
MKTNLDFCHISLSSYYNDRYFRKKFVKKIETCILCSIIFFFENRAFYEITRKIIVQPDRL